MKEIRRAKSAQSIVVGHEMRANQALVTPVLAAQAAQHDLGLGLLQVSGEMQQPGAGREDSSLHTEALLEPIARGGNADRFLDAATTALLRRILFTTASGLKGIGPQAASPGDEMCILYGSSIPFIVRRTGEAYQLIGECYVRDVMQGEALKKLGEKLEAAETWIELI